MTDSSSKENKTGILSSKNAGLAKPPLVSAHSSQASTGTGRSHARATRLLILMSDTGGGHRSAAEAIAEAMAHLYHDTIQISIVDALVHYMPFPWNQVGHLYAPVVNRAPWLWRLLWWLTDSPQRTRWLFATLRPWVEPKLRQLFLSARPHVVVSVHPAINHLGVWTLRRMGLKTPFVIVVTDLVQVHPLWLCPQADLCLTPTEEARQGALRAGLSPDQTCVVGQPVSMRFTHGLPEKRSALARLGLHPDLPLVLLMGGGEGVGRISEIARAIAEARLPAQMAIVSGRNEKLQRQLQTIAWGIPTCITGFVNNVQEWMAAADVLITKAGPGVISEAFIAGLPLILSGAIPGQESPNVAYVVSQGAGIAETDPARMAAWLAQRLKPDDQVLTHMATAARRLARPDAALHVARQIVALLPGCFQKE